jgi:hypothetical protein
MLILLYKSRRQFHVVPSHFFPDESAFEAFADVVQKRLGKTA